MLVASPGPYGLAPSLWQLSARAPDVLATLLLAQAGGGGLLGIEAVRRALFTEDTPRDWIADVAAMPDRESPLALLDGLTWDLPAWFLVRRVPVLAVLGDRDAFVPVTDLWAIAMAYGAETELVRGAAHGLPIDPHWRSLAWRINAWIDERGIGSAAAAGRSRPGRAVAAAAWWCRNATIGRRLRGQPPVGIESRGFLRKAQRLTAERGDSGHERPRPGSGVAGHRHCRVRRGGCSASCSASPWC